MAGLAHNTLLSVSLLSTLTAAWSPEISQRAWQVKRHVPGHGVMYPSGRYGMHNGYGGSAMHDPTSKGFVRGRRGSRYAVKNNYRPEKWGKPRGGYRRDTSKNPYRERIRVPAHVVSEYEMNPPPHLRDHGGSKGRWSRPYKERGHHYDDEYRSDGESEGYDGDRYSYGYPRYRNKNSSRPKGGRYGERGVTKWGGDDDEGRNEGGGGLYGKREYPFGSGKGFHHDEDSAGYKDWPGRSNDGYDLGGYASSIGRYGGRSGGIAYLDNGGKKKGDGAGHGHGVYGGHQAADRGRHGVGYSHGGSHGHSYGGSHGGSPGIRHIADCSCDGQSWRHHHSHSPSAKSTDGYAFHDGVGYEGGHRPSSKVSDEEGVGYDVDHDFAKDSEVNIEQKHKSHEWKHYAEGIKR